MSVSMVRMTVPMNRVMKPQKTKKWARPVLRSRLATVELEAMAASDVCRGRDRASCRPAATSSFSRLRVCSHISRHRPMARPRRYFLIRFQA